ncbi:uncharacterized protein LOC123871595 isoform X2 [Maniola jurtina]|nr:uncharacterized protein LOC123871595 isoform X2 [Maniola jurtina]XP_045771436.1 uncharacterized protein LOC123871595 isoform X2 [Maniola jurtina]
MPTQIECYMDELIDCFEDFVKKSLIVISVGIAAIVGLLLYLLKVVSYRPPSNIITESAANDNNNNQTGSMGLEETKNQKRLFNFKLLQKKSSRQGSNTSLSKGSSTKIVTDVNTVSGHINTSPLTKKLSFDEKVLRDVGLTSCSKLHTCERTNSHSYIPCRVPVSSKSPTNRKSDHAIRSTQSKNYIPAPLPICPKSPKKGSCCSICCEDQPLS